MYNKKTKQILFSYILLVINNYLYLIDKVISQRLFIKKAKKKKGLLHCGYNAKIPSFIKIWSILLINHIW